MKLITIKTWKDMKTGKLGIISLLGAAFLAGCTHMEEPVDGASGKEIRVSAGIAEATRAVINGDYANDLEISFARLDNPTTSGSAWNASSIDAVRAGGAGDKAITFDPVQNYLSSNGESVLIGYYPRKVLNSGTLNPVSVSYTITGDEDVMATEVQTGSLNAPFSAFTFRHLLTQLQFKCTGTAGAAAAWTQIASITVKNVATGLTLSLDKTDGATLAATGSADQSLTVKSCPTTVSATTVSDPPVGYVMVYPATNMGTESVPIKLEVKATYSGASKTIPVDVKNINGGAKAGQSHLVTLTFTEDGKIAAEAGIAPWQTGSGGSSVVTPGS